MLMAAWKLAPALAAGNCVVLKPAEQTPASIMMLMELVGDLLPAGVLNIVNGYGAEAGRRWPPASASPRSPSPAPRRSAPHHALRGGELIPHRGARRQVAEHLLQRHHAAGGRVHQQVVEGLVLAFFNQGEVCTCPSRAADPGGHLRPSS
jgi:aldehyde dehydrogenase